MKYKAGLVVLSLCSTAGGQGLRRIFSKVYTVSPYTLECYLPQITNGPDFPTWSADGKELAFGMRGSIWRIRLGETTAHELATDAGYASQPAWSPDGRWIAYTSDLHEQIHLKLLDLHTGAVTQLTSGNSINVEPEWSPDGTRLAYVSTVPKGNYNIYIMSLRDGHPGTSQMITSDFELIPPTVYYGNWALHISPTWTRDGKELIFISNRDNKHGSGGFYRMKAEPGAQMHRFYYEETTWKARPTLSPDGVKLVYSSYLGGQWQQLWAMPPHGGDAFPLTYGDFDRTTPRWSPDGNRIAFISNETGDTNLWLFHWFGGRLEPVRIEKLNYRRPMARLHVRINDETGNRTRARVHLTAADGRSYAPAGAWFHADWLMFDHIDRSEYHYFHAPGEFDLDLPAGTTKFQVSKGFEYRPVDRDVPLSAGKTATITIDLKRLDNLPAKGWWSSENHFHMNYGGAYRNTPKHLLEQADAEDIHMLNNLICNKEQRVPDIEYFRGAAADPASTSERMLYHNQEYHPPFWGHSVFLNLTQHFIIPAYVGYQNTVVSSLYPPNTVPFQIVRKEGGLVGYAHGAGLNFATDLALENVDFVEGNSIGGMEPLYRAWNCGYHVAASAGEDAFPNFYRSYVLGANRVYVYTGGKLDHAKWLASFRAGRSFVTTGPLVLFHLDGKQPGDEIRRPAGTHELTAEVEIESITPIRLVQVFYNNRVIAEEKPTNRPHKLRFDKTVAAGHSGWFSVQVSAEDAYPLRHASPFAVTMPVWLTVDGRPVRSRKDAEYFIAWIDDTLKKALAQIAWNNETEREQTRKLYAEAKARMTARRDEAH